jgi:very-short-patch-repair endonuclease
MRYYCNVCKETISEEVYEYSKKHFSKPLCMNHQRMLKDDKAHSSKITPQARKLSAALARRGIKNSLEEYDGYKHVDISIQWANLNIEIDGKHHLLDARQLYSDLERDSFSHDDEKSTIRISNDMVDKNLDKLADSIAKVARKKYREEDSSLF